MLELILSSGGIGLTIAFMFTVALFVVVERWIVLERASSGMQAFADEFEAALANTNRQQAIQDAIVVCDKDKGGGEIPAIYRIALAHVERGPATLRNILQNQIDLLIIPRLRYRLGFLATIGKSAPMLGLIGTVWGMIGAFSTIAGTTGQGVSPKQLAGDIGLALGTTFLGLLVAIPVVFAVTFLRSRVEQFEIDLDRYSQKCLDSLFPTNPPSLP